MVLDTVTDTYSWNKIYASITKRGMRHIKQHKLELQRFEFK